MKGIPNMLQTKQDYENVVELAKRGEVDKDKVIAAMDNLIAVRHYNEVKEASKDKKAEDLTPDDFELVVDPNSQMKKIGFTLKEIGELKGGL